MFLHNYLLACEISTVKTFALKMKEKLKIMRENIVDYNVMHTMNSRIINYVQLFLRNIIFHKISYILFLFL